MTVLQDGQQPWTSGLFDWCVKYRTIQSVAGCKFYWHAIVTYGHLSNCLHDNMTCNHACIIDTCLVAARVRAVLKTSPAFALDSGALPFSTGAQLQRSSSLLHQPNTEHHGSVHSYHNNLALVRPVALRRNVSATRGGGACLASCLMCFCCCFQCFFAGGHRGDLRRKYNLPEQPLHDCLLHW